MASEIELFYLVLLPLLTGGEITPWMRQPCCDPL
jgi:hypothetical protein